MVIATNSELGVIGVDLFTQLRMVDGISNVLKVRKPKTLDELPLVVEMADKYSIGIELNGKPRVYVQDTSI